MGCIRANHVSERMILLQHFDCSSVGDLGVLEDLNSDEHGTHRQEKQSHCRVWITHGFSPSSSTKSSYLLGAFMAAEIMETLH